MSKKLSFYLVLSLVFAQFAWAQSAQIDNSKDEVLTTGEKIELPYQTVNFDGGEAVLFDNGPIISLPAGGCAGGDASILDGTVGGHTLYGWGHQQNLGNYMADDFTSAASWNIDSLKFFGYQSFETTSTITGVYVQIWSGSPMAGGTIVWGDLTTNRLQRTGLTNIYRAQSTTPTNCDRRIQEVVATVGVNLPAGQYWIQWGETGTSASGPWCPPVTIPGVAITGDALQNVAGVWAAALNGTSPNGAPFIVYGSVVGGTITIAQAIEDLDNDFVPDRLGDTVTVQGVVFSPNYQTTNNSYYISDGTAGTDIFMYSPPLYSWDMGDELNITGVVTQYNGMSEIIPVDSTGWVFMNSGNPTPNPTILSLAQFKANAELYEGSLVGFTSLSLVSGTWPAGGSSSNLSLSDGVDTVVFRIDSDTDIDGSPEPAWPVDIIGIGSQFDNSAPYNSGYQVFPRFYSTDFLPAGSLPVELTSFSANVNEGSVYLNWTTATELNNNGFEVQRAVNSEFHSIGFVQGHGTTTNIQNYSFVDQNVVAGKYTYRLKQVDFNGTFAYSNVVEVEILSVKEFVLEQNYPNPFNPGTTINFSLAVDSKVSLKIFDVLGQEVATLVNGQLAAGNHPVSFDASSLNSGVYFYRIDANGSDGQKFSSVKKMILTK